MGKTNFIGIIVLMVLISSCNQSGKQTGGDATDYLQTMR